MRRSLKIATGNAVKTLTEYAEKLPAGLENLSYSAMIRLLRDKLWMTQAQLAQRAGVPQSHIAKIEKGKMSPRLDTIKKIFEALHCDVLLLAKPAKSLDAILNERIARTARKNIEAIAGTMRLENQLPSAEQMAQLLAEEEEKISRNPTSKIWED